MCSIYLFADDIVLLANTEIEEFCSGWEHWKTKILVINKPARSSQFVVCNTPLEQVKEFKYLSVMLLENQYLNLHVKSWPPKPY